MDNKLDRLFFVCLTFAVMGYIFTLGVRSSRADTGKYAATRVEVGNTLQTRRILVSDGTAIAVVAAADNRPDATCMNSSAFGIRLSSSQAVASLQVMGIPILSSGTFKLGSLSGAASAVIEAGNAGSTATIICADGLTL